MKFSALTYVCRNDNCRELFDRAPHGCCPRCQNDDVWPVSTLLNPRWLEQWRKQIGMAGVRKKRHLRLVQRLPQQDINPLFYLTHREHN